ERDQQDNRADEGVDDRGDNTATDYYADLGQQPASEQTAENANDDVAYQPVTTAFDHHTGKPTSDGTDDQPNDECLYVHLSPRFLLARKGLVPSQLLYSRFFDGPRRREGASGQWTAIFPRPSQAPCVDRQRPSSAAPAAWQCWPQSAAPRLWPVGA